MRHLAYIRSITIVALTILTLAVTPVLAQQLGPDGAPNPTASVASEQQLLLQSPRIEGLIAQPSERARVLMQPAGREWNHFHEITLRWLGTIVILGMIVALGAAYLIMGRLRISKGRSERKVAALQRLRAFFALADRRLLRDPRCNRVEHYVRKDRSIANDRPRGV